MPSPFTKALSAGLATVRAVAGDVVTYERGDTRVAVTAVAGSTDYSAEMGDIVVDRFTARDFLIEVADVDERFDNAGETFDEPKRGDRIVDDAIGSTYEVFPATGDQLFEFADPDESEYRIHTKKVA